MRTPAAALAAALAALVACGGAPTEAERRCGVLQERIVSCTKEAWPPGALHRFRRYCDHTLAYEPEPGGTGKSLMDDLKEKLSECAAADSCDALHACFQKHRCALVVARPGAAPDFQCL